MPFVSILASSCFAIKYDKRSGHLFVKLTAPNGQAALSSPAIPVPYSSDSCLIQDNLPAWVKGEEVLAWLTRHFTPALLTADIIHWAWVCSPTLRSHHLAEQLVQLLPQVQLTVFNDLEHAATWLQQRPPVS